MQGDNVRSFKEFVQLNEGAIAQLSADLAHGVERDNFHAECLSKLASCLTDSTIADNAHSLAGEFNQRVIPKAEVRTACPTTLLHGLRVMRHVMTNL